MKYKNTWGVNSIRIALKYEETCQDDVQKKIVERGSCHLLWFLSTMDSVQKLQYDLPEMLLVAMKMIVMTKGTNLVTACCDCYIHRSGEWNVMLIVKIRCAKSWIHASALAGQVYRPYSTLASGSSIINLQQIYYQYKQVGWGPKENLAEGPKCNPVQGFMDCIPESRPVGEREKGWKGGGGH